MTRLQSQWSLFLAGGGKFRRCERWTFAFEPQLIPGTRAKCFQEARNKAKLWTAERYEYCTVCMKVEPS